MAKQTSSIKAVGRVDNLSFYRQEGGYRARRKTGVDTKRYHNDPAYANTRASSGRFGRASTLLSLVYRYVLPGFKSDTLSNLCKKKAIALVNELISEEEVLRRLHSFLDELHCLAITSSDFEMNIPALLREADTRALSRSRRRKKETREKITFIISEPPTEEDKELLIHESNDFDWDVVFAGEFPQDYEIPLLFTSHLVDDFRGFTTVLTKPREKIRDEWVLLE
jgi:hypothetical protein